MKPTDKCECGHIKQMHDMIDGCVACKCIEFKSHSQKIPSQPEKAVGNVRAYGDKIDEMVNHLQPSPMPYTPLTKQKIKETLQNFRELEWITSMDINDTDEVIERRLDAFTNHLYNLNLSALNGLREDFNNIRLKNFYDLEKLSEKQKISLAYHSMDMKDEFNRLLKKHFPIINEAKEE